MKFVIWVVLTLIASSSLCVAQQQQADSSEITVSISHRDTLNRYCVACHNDALKTAGLSLQTIDVVNVGEGSEIWEKVLRKLKARSMPPGGIPRPDESTYLDFANYLETELDLHAQTNPHPGEITLRRLNRTEYVNSIKDLLAVSIDGDALLPPDDAMYGFDNIGAALTISPLLTERYISAAHEIRRQAIGDPGLRPDFSYYSVSNELRQEDRMGEELPFGSRGGMTIEHHFPVDGEYIFQVRLLKNYRDYIRGFTNKPYQLDVRLDGERLKLFTVGGEKHGISPLLFSNDMQGDPEQEEYERYADKSLEIRLPVKAGIRSVTATFLNESTMSEGPTRPQLTQYDYIQYKGGKPGVSTIAIGGPFNESGIGTTVSREKIFICRPTANNDETCARQILTNLARLAYRGQPSDEEIGELLKFYNQGQQEGGFEEGIGMALERMLAGPEFLFLIESVPENAKQDEIFHITDIELATSLSLFLWSSIPDNELLSIAESGRLSEPEILEQQIQRMLDDPRSDAIIHNFAAQWLNLGKLNVAVPDTVLFPFFDDNLKQAFETETKLFFEYIFRNERPLVELIDADYTFVNERLAEHYGIPNIYGNHFRKVILQDKSRGGILGQASILTVTSYANRTAPTIRGKWVLENILSSPPPPPPPNVPGLESKNNEGKVLSMREAMEQHRANPVCATCHKVMDPLGFALENYDAIGRWRTIDAYANSPVDSSGQLPDGAAFEGLTGLKKVLLEKRRDDFVLTVIEKLMTYALGREIEHTDKPIMRTIMRETSDDEYKLSSIITSIVNSTPFIMRRVPNDDI